MAKDYLNVIERALMMGISDNINSLTESGEDIHVFGEFPEVEELKFPAVIVQHTGSGFEEQFMGQGVTLGTTSGTGEIYLGSNLEIEKLSLSGNYEVTVSKDLSILVKGQATVPDQWLDASVGKLNYPDKTYTVIIEIIDGSQVIFKDG